MVTLPGEMNCASEAVAATVQWIGWLGKARGFMICVVMLRHALARLRRARERGLRMFLIGPIRRARHPDLEGL